jgi:hypothetical protein
MAVADPPGRRRRALLVATATYADPGLAQLRAPSGDVDSLAGVLGDGTVGRFDVQELVDRPTEEVKRTIEGFFADARPDDLLLLYFSGHGVLSQSRRFYFATATTALDFLRATAIEDSFVNAVMQESRARSIVLILDCCHSGAFGKGLAPKSTMTVDVEHRFEGRGRVTLSASTELEYAFEESDPATGINELGAAEPGSLFTRCLVDGLSSGEADLDGDGEIAVDELYDYVCQRVRERSPHQTPGMAGDVRGEIVIARSRRRPALPPELTQAVGSTLAGVREGAVSELATLAGSSPPALAAVAREALERLARDDSRRVSAAAEAALGRERPATVSPPAPPEEPPAAPPKAPPAAPPEEPPAAPPPRPPQRRPAILAAAGAVVVAGLVAAGLLLGGGGGGGETGPTTPGQPYDFDNDGRQEIILGAARGIEADGEEPVGIVLAHAGTESEEGVAIRSEDAGVPGPATRTDRFGAALASGDFDRDGTPDLAIGVPGRDRVAVLYSPSPDNVRSKAITADDVPSPPVTRSFGLALAAADFDDDGYVDLAVGTPGTPFQRAQYEPGSVHIVPGGARGLDAGAARAIQAPEDTSGFGTRLAAGDLDRDGNVDLVVGSLDEPDGPNTGYIAFCLGSPEGPDSCKVAESNTEIATSALVVGDLNRDGYADVVQGDQGNEDAGEEFPNEAGEVRLWLGRKGGPSGDPVVITQASPGIPGDPEPGDEFGHDVDVGDVDGDGLADIIVAAHGDEGGTGTVTVIRGARSGYAKSAAYMLEAPGKDEGYLGGSVALLDLDDDEEDLLDLVVAREDAPSPDEAIIVYMRRGNSFQPGVALSGLNALATLDASPLRLGR